MAPMGWNCVGIFWISTCPTHICFPNMNILPRQAGRILYVVCIPQPSCSHPDMPPCSPKSHYEHTKVTLSFRLPVPHLPSKITASWDLTNPLSTGYEAQTHIPLSGKSTRNIMTTLFLLHYKGLLRSTLILL